LKTRTRPWRQTVKCVIRMGLLTVRITAPRTKSPGEYWRCGSSGRMWNSVRLRARDFRGEVNLENKERLDDVEGEGVCESVGVAFAHMSESGDVFDAKSSTGGAKGPEILDGGHVQSRTVRTCDAQTLGVATGRARCWCVLQMPSMRSEGY
jgi:hypothetical protein